MFNAIFIRIIVNKIKKTFSIIMIIRVISIIEATFILTIKPKQNTTFKKLICYNYNKINYYRKDCIIQDQIEINKKILKKARLHCLDIDNK